MEALHHFGTKASFYLSGGKGSVYCDPRFPINLVHLCSEVELRCLLSELKPYGFRNWPRVCRYFLQGMLCNVSCLWDVEHVKAHCVGDALESFSGSAVSVSGHWHYRTLLSNVL